MTLHPKDAEEIESRHVAQMLMHKPLGEQCDALLAYLGTLDVHPKGDPRIEAGHSSPVLQAGGEPSPAPPAANLHGCHDGRCYEHDWTATDEALLSDVIADAVRAEVPTWR